MTSDESRVDFAEVERVLALTASCLVGRAVVLAPTATCLAQASQWTIALLSAMDAFATRDANRAAYRSLLLLGMGLICWDDDAQETARQRALARSRASWRRVFRAFEEVRVHGWIASRFPGAAVDVAMLRERRLAARMAVLPPRGLRGVAEHILRWALGDDSSAPIVRSALSAEAALDNFTGRARAGQASWRDSAHLASLVCERAWRRAGVSAPSSATVRSESVLDGEGELSTSDASEQLELQATAARPGGTRGRLATADDGVQDLSAIESADPSAEHAATDNPAAAAPPLPFSSPAPGERHVYLPEWDSTVARFLPRWCRVVESRPRIGDATPLTQARNRNAPILARIREEFMAAQPRSRRLPSAATAGDSVDIDRAIEDRADRSAGAAGRDDLYERRERAQRDVAITLLLDVSASTAFPIPDPAGIAQGKSAEQPEDDDDAGYLYGRIAAAPMPAPALRRRVIDVAKEAAALLAEAASELGDACAIHGFSGDGRARVDVRIVKTWAEPFGAPVLSRLAALEPIGSTRTGAALRHAVQALAAEPSEHKVLLVVTDGYPQDTDYGPASAGVAYGVADTAHALQEARALGIMTYCIAIDPAGEDYLRDACASDQYLQLDDVAALPQRLAAVYQALVV